MRTRTGTEEAFAALGDVLANTAEELAQAQAANQVLWGEIAERDETIASLRAELADAIGDEAMAALEGLTEPPAPGTPRPTMSEMERR